MKTKPTQPRQLNVWIACDVGPNGASVCVPRDDNDAFLIVDDGKSADPPKRGPVREPPTCEWSGTPTQWVKARLTFGHAVRGTALHGTPPVHAGRAIDEEDL